MKTSQLSKSCRYRLHHGVLFLIAAVFLNACETISRVDQAAYDKTTSAKAEALALMDKATGSYSANTSEVEKVKLNISKAYEYDRGRKLNQITVQMWNKLLDSEGRMWGGFLRLWQKKGSLPADYIMEKKKDVGDAFDQISALEIGKNKPGN